MLDEMSGYNRTMSKAIKRAVRSFIQFVAAGGVTALVDQLIVDLDPETAVIITIAFGTFVSYLQNALEDAGTVKPILK